MRAAAAASNVAPATAYRWWHRWQATSEDERGLAGVPADPPFDAGQLSVGASPADEQAILRGREKTNWGPMGLTYLARRHRSTIWKVLARHGVSHRRRSALSQTSRRYVWTRPGLLLHVDAFEVPKFSVPGRWAAGRRAERRMIRQAGKTVVIGVIDGRTRLAAASCMAPRTRSPSRRRCAARPSGLRIRAGGTRHILIPPYTPRWNGKIERFFGTLDSEWAHGRIWPNSTRRDRVLSSFMRFYNRRRPRSAGAGRAPITRVQRVGEDS